MRQLVALALFALPGVASASFHLMQIEQALGAVNGDSSVQAVELRMRAAGQNQVQNARLVAVDATGANIVVIVDMANPVTNSAQGDRILIATARFAQQELVTPDFIMTNPIPASYLAGGQLRFLQDGTTTPLWALCWGTFSGSTIGLTTNDADGNFGPCEPGNLPSTGLTALKFGPNEIALSTNNSADYAETASTAIFHNNARNSAGLQPPLLGDGFEDP